MRYLLLAGVAAVTLGGFNYAQAQEAEAVPALSKGDVEDTIRSYLLENPDLIVEALDVYRQNQAREQQERAAAKIDEHKDALTGASQPSVGNVNADVVVTEFFDYNCGYCKRAFPDVQALVDADKNVRFVFKEMPILSANSRDMARFALAAHKQGKYFEYHGALMEARGQKDEDALRKIGEDLGLDGEKLVADAASQEIEEQLVKNIAVARDVGATGTPAFVINGKLYPGYLGPDGLKQAIEDARKGDS